MTDAPDPATSDAPDAPMPVPPDSMKVPYRLLTMKSNGQ
jgi:hypothetical protein